MIGEWLSIHKRLMMIVGMVFVTGLIVLAIFLLIPGEKTDDQDAPDNDVYNIAVAEVYDVDPSWPYLIICFDNTPNNALVDTSGLFELQVMSFDDKCVDFLINNGNGIGSAGEYDIYVSAVAQNDIRLDREKVTVHAIDSLDASSGAGVMQNEAANRNNDSGP